MTKEHDSLFHYVSAALESLSHDEQAVLLNRYGLERPDLEQDQRSCTGNLEINTSTEDLGEIEEEALRNLRRARLRLH